MKLYLVERTDKWSYDDYDSFVCLAKDKEEARYMAPDPEFHMWKDGQWCYSYREQEPCSMYSWTKDPTTLNVTEIFLEDRTEPEVLCASFNAG